MAKETKNRLMHSGAVLLAMIGMLIVADECRAVSYRPVAAVRILSEYAALKDSAPPHTQVWKVAPEIAPNVASILRFFPEGSVGSVPVCVLRLPPPEAPGEIRWEGTEKAGKKNGRAGMLLLPGYPAPCDVLPVDRGDTGGAYEERTVAGGRVFFKSYRVSFTAFSVADAKAMNWIRVDDPGKSGLIMVAVTDEKGRPVVKQLWPADGSWWLYEETPLRRSWVIY